MKYEPEDFVGTYVMQQGSVLTLLSGPIRPEGDQRFVQAGNTVYVGTGPASPLRKTDAGWEVGVVVMDGPIQQYPTSGSTPCLFDVDNRFFLGVSEKIVIQISLYWDRPAQYRTVYGVLTYGDPENVGVWGANDQGG